jgi:site-specific DNA-methyltransferase (adenine-specific)
MMAYLVMMAVRLRELQNKLKQTGSLYLHCDPTASHHLKIILDGIFGADNFRNEIIWKRTGSHGGSKRWGPVHDTILFYTKSSSYTWNRTFQGYEQKYLDDYYRFNDERGRYRLVTLTGAGVRSGDSGKAWRGVDPTNSGRHWAVPMQALQRAYPKRDLSGLTTQEKLDLLDQAGLVYWPTKGTVPQQKRYSDENPGVPIQDMITDIGPISSHAHERIGYPTQKPISLLKRIIEASSRPGDVVLDPFCGCGTTIEASQVSNRQWIGIDVAVHAIKVIEARLADLSGTKIRYAIEGMPRDFASAVKLAERDKYQFQWWANYLFNPHALREQKKGADRGIDGELFFPNGPGRPWGRMLTSVKGGTSTGPAMIRDFRGVLEREKAQMGLFICLHSPTKAMQLEAASAGMADTVHGSLPKLQIVAIENWFNGKLPKLPPLEHLPSAAFATTRRRVPTKVRRPDPAQPEFQYSFRGGKGAKEVVHFNPLMVREVAGREAEAQRA